MGGFMLGDAPVVRPDAGLWRASERSIDDGTSGHVLLADSGGSPPEGGSRCGVIVAPTRLARVGDVTMHMRLDRSW